MVKKKIEFVEGTVPEFVQCLVKDDKAYRLLKKMYLEAEAKGEKMFMNNQLNTKFTKYAFEYADGERRRLMKKVYDGKKWVK